MAIQYPDVMNDLTDARHRFEAGCVQYLAEFEGGPAIAGGMARLVLTLQNTVDAPARLAVRFALPQMRGRVRRRVESLFQIQESVLRLTLDDGEVGQVIVPVYVAPEVSPETYEFGVHVESATHESAQRTRPESSENQTQDLKIVHPQGLGISQLLSWGYETQPQAEQVVPLTVIEGEGLGSESLAPQYVSAWTPEGWDVIAAARREWNDRRLHILPDLDTRRLFRAFLRESQAVLGELGIQLDLGEALFIAKMLTYTTSYLMEVPAWQDCLLVPILAYAHAEALPTTEVRPLVTGVGYPHVLELAIALAFPLIAEALGRELWEETEQRALRDLILQCQSTGAPLPVEFLYLPLILGGLAVAHELVMEGENVQQSLDLLSAAKAKRAEPFADPELSEINDVFEELMTIQRSR